MTGVIITIVAIVIIAKFFIYIKYRGPVKILPKEVAIVSQPGSMKTTFNVQNRTSKALFDVWIKIVFKNCDIGFRHIKVYLGDGNESLSEKNSGTSKNYYSARLDGLDNKGKGLIFFIFSKLIPKIPQSFTIEIVYKDNMPDIDIDEAKKPQISLSLARSSKKPLELLELGGEISYPFVPPKDFKLKRVFLNIKK